MATSPLDSPGSLNLLNAIPRAKLSKLIDQWLEEDCPGFDYGAAVVGNRLVSAVLFAKSPGLLAGCVLFDAVFDRLGCEIDWEPGVHEGLRICSESLSSKRLQLATVSGPACLILQGERVALNALAECSGVATVAAQYVSKARRAGWNGVLAGTRKTTPGFRLVQKYGMLVGGMDTHRMDLSSMIMLKDNHIAAAGSIRQAVASARAVGGFSLKIDVECSSFSDAVEAAEAGAEIVMLDNFDPEKFRETATALRKRFQHLIIEGSGGLNEETIESYFCEAANVLSFSVNRHAAPMDLSLKIK